jgi:hypothetical protein
MHVRTARDQRRQEPLRALGLHVVGLPVPPQLLLVVGGCRVVVEAEPVDPQPLVRGVRDHAAPVVAELLVAVGVVLRPLRRREPQLLPAPVVLLGALHGPATVGDLLIQGLSLL